MLETIEHFGTVGADGLRRPFHSYPLGQADDNDAE